MAEYEVWNKIVNYKIGDKVVYLGNIYIATADNIDVLPTNLAPNWSLYIANAFPPAYGYFYSDIDETLTAGFIAPLNFTGQTVANGVSLFGGSPTTAITVSNSGVYEVCVVGNIHKLLGGNDICFMYLTYNGNPVALASVFVEQNQNDGSTATLNTILQINAGDLIGVSAYSATGNGFTFEHQVATLGSPDTPSISISINRIQ